MAWNFSNTNPNQVHTVAPEAQDYPNGHHYFIWHTDEAVVLPLNRVPEKYTLRDWQGGVVTTAIGSSTTLNLGLLPAGHYRLYFEKPGANHSTFGDACGAINISIWRRKSGMPNRPNNQNISWVPADDQNLINAMDATMARFPIDSAVDPENSGAVVLWHVQSDMARYRSGYMSRQDPVRPRREAIIHFRNGTREAGSAEGVANVISKFGTDDVWYECRNEPDNDTHAQDFLPELIDFYTMVKAANPNAKVLGPNQVSLNEGSLGWSERLFKDGGGDYIDGYSFHAYNVCSGELQRGRRNAERFIKLLEKYNQHTKPRWMTEWGTFASTYGSFTPMRQLRWTMMELIFWEQYGVPMERFSLFYNRSHGFWDYPSFVVTDYHGLLPTATAIRVYAEEIRGHLFTERLNFGDEDNNFIGSRYASVSGDVVVLMACGRHGDQMKFTISGAGQIEVVDTMGSSQVHQVVNNSLTLPIPGAPIYLRLPPGATLQPAPRILGRNLVKAGRWSKIVSSPGNSQAYNLVDSKFDQNYPYAWVRPLPVTITLTFGQDTTFDTIYIRGTQPWQTRSAILDATVEVYENDQWVQVGTIHNNYNFFEFPAGPRDTGCWSETYYDEKHSWLIDVGRQVRAREIRVIVTKCTKGGEAVEVHSDDGQGLDEPRLSLQGVEVYNAEQTISPNRVVRGE